MSQLRVVDRAERDWKMQPGDVAVLNSGGPVMTVTDVLSDGRRMCEWDGGSSAFASEVIRPPFEMRLLMVMGCAS